MSERNIHSTDAENYGESRCIKGKRYFKHQIRSINKEAAQFDCPFSFTTQTVCNTIHDARVPHIGMTAIRDNDVVNSKFNKCTGCNCMAFDPETITCLRCK